MRARCALLLTSLVVGCGRPRSSQVTAPSDTAVVSAVPIAPARPAARDGGVVIDSRKDDRDLGRFCKSSVSYPILSGSKNQAAEHALNVALAREARVDASRCRGSSETYPYAFEVTYRVVDASHPDVLELYVERFENLAGAHGFTSGKCYLADLEKGALTALVVGLFPRAARARLEALTRAALAPSKDSLFGVDSLVLDDATLCVEGDGLQVIFSAGLAGPWMNGPVSATIAAADARPLAVGTPFEVLFP